MDLMQLLPSREEFINQQLQIKSVPPCIFQKNKQKTWNFLHLKMQFLTSPETSKDLPTWGPTVTWQPQTRTALDLSCPFPNILALTGWPYPGHLPWHPPRRHHVTSTPGHFWECKSLWIIITLRWETKPRTVPDKLEHIVTLQTSVYGEAVSGGGPPCTHVLSLLTYDSPLAITLFLCPSAAQESHLPSLKLPGAPKS